jgi:hypothetical protein
MEQGQTAPDCADHALSVLDVALDQLYALRQHAARALEIANEGADGALLGEERCEDRSSHHPGRTCDQRLGHRWAHSGPLRPVLRSRALRRSLALLLMTAACQRETLGIELPPRGTATSGLLIIERDERHEPTAPTIVAFEEPVSIPLPFFDGYDGSRVAATVLFFADHLSTIGIEVEGPLHSPPASPPGILIPFSDAVNSFQRIVSGSSTGTWSVITDPAQHVASTLVGAKIDGQATCAQYVSKQVSLHSSTSTLPDENGLNFVVRVNDTQVIVATYTPDQHFFRITPDTIPPKVEELTANIPNPALIRAARTPDGEVILADDNGKIWTAAVSTESSTLSLTLLVDSQMNSFPGVLAGTSKDLFVVWRNNIDVPHGCRPLAVDGVVQHFDGKTLTTLEGLFPRPGTPCAAQMPQDIVDLLWMAPNEAALVATSTPAIVHYQGGVRNDIPLTANTTRRDLNAIGYIAGLGYLVGNARGKVYRSDDLKSFSDLGDTGFGANVYSFTPFRDGFLWGGWAGEIGQYLGGQQTFCLPPMQIAGSDVDFVVKVGEWYVIGGATAQTVTESSVTLLKPAP